jgi:iron complex transport system substrate-binding protein
MPASALLIGASLASLRVASLNLCTDELLLALAAPEEIASVTHLAHKPQETTLWRQARRYPQNDGSLLSVVGDRPDLVLTMGGGARDRARIARRLGIHILDLPFPQRLADVELQIRAVADALGRHPAGMRWIARLDALKRSRPRRQIDTIWLGGGGRSVQATGLAADWMRLAGFRQRPLNGDRVSLEQLLVRPPAVVLRSDYRSGEYSGAQRWLMHPLAKATGRSRRMPTDGRAWTCMGPPMVDEIVRLRGQVRR